MRKALGETQALRAGCSKAEPKIFAPPQTPLPGMQDGQNLISWRWSLPAPTNPVWWGLMHAISSYCGNRSTNTHTHLHTHTNKQTHRQDQLQYTAPLSLARSLIKHSTMRSSQTLCTAVSTIIGFHLLYKQHSAGINMHTYFSLYFQRPCGIMSDHWEQQILAS